MYALLFLIAWQVWAGDPIRPNPRLTPGDVVAAVTVDQICVAGYARRARHVTQATRDEVFRRYFGHVPEDTGRFEMDHLISLQLGGSNDVKNLWPEAYAGPWGARTKDRLEGWMHRSVARCLEERGRAAATRLLRRYQAEIAADWIAAYKRYCAKSRRPSSG